MASPLDPNPELLGCALCSACPQLEGVAPLWLGLANGRTLLRIRGLGRPDVIWRQFVGNPEPSEGASIGDI